MLYIAHDCIVSSSQINEFKGFNGTVCGERKLKIQTRENETQWEENTGERESGWNEYMHSLSVQNAIDQLTMVKEDVSKMKVREREKDKVREKKYGKEPFGA